MADPLEPTVVYAFGPFTLDAGTRRLTREGKPVALPDRHADILLALLAHAGQVVSKDALVQAAWKDVAVTDNSLEQAISALRRSLGQSAGGPSYIGTLARRGYRLGVPVTRTAPRYSLEALEALLAPHRTLVEGRAALETLKHDAIELARSVFEEVVRSSPHYAPAHIGLANALTLLVEAARAGGGPADEALARAQQHAHEACRLDPSSADAWSVLGLVFHQLRESVNAAAAARRATSLDPHNWRHHLRLAYVSWGEERLGAAHRVLTLCPGVALAHWLAATVYIARQAFTEAERELVAGAAAQARQDEGARFGAVGLHLALGLLRLSQGDTRSALDDLSSELSSGGTAHIYARQARANAWCALAGLRLRTRSPAGAIAALDEAVRIVPGHAVAVAARAALTQDASGREVLDQRVQAMRDRDAVIDAAWAEAVFHNLAGDAAGAARVIDAALRQDAAPGAGWTLPIDPLLDVGTNPEPWAPVLARLRSGAA